MGKMPMPQYLDGQLAGESSMDGRKLVRENIAKNKKCIDIW